MCASLASVTTKNPMLLTTRVHWNSKVVSMNVMEERKGDKAKIIANNISKYILLVQMFCSRNDGASFTSPNPTVMKIIWTFFARQFIL